MQKSGHIDDKHRFLTAFIVLVGMALILLNAVRYNMQKEDFFLDEKYTFYAANAHIISIKDFLGILKEYSLEEISGVITENVPPVSNHVYTIDEMDALFDAQKGYGLNYFSTILIDSSDSHPPFYYFLFNTVNSLFPFLSLKNVGFVINSFALLLTCFFVFRCVILLSGSTAAALAAMLFYGLSFDFINNVTYIRMYSYMSLWLTSLLYLHLQLVENNYKQEKALLIKICLIEFLGMYTQFFAALFIFPMVVITIVFYRRKGLSLKSYVSKQILIAVVYLLVWPVSLLQIINDESGADVRANLSIRDFAYKLKGYIHVLKDSLFAGSKVLLLIVLGITVIWVSFSIILMINKKAIADFLGSKSFEKIIYLIVPAMVYYLIVVNVSPWITDRYVMPAIPIISMIFVLAIWSLLERVIKKETICAFALIAFVLVVLIGSLKLTPHYLYRMTSEKRDFIESYNDYNAIIVEPAYDSEFMDACLSVKHPLWVMTRENELHNMFENEAIVKEPCVVYINQFCDADGVLQSFEKQGYKLAKCEYEKDFYDVYAFVK